MRLKIKKKLGRKISNFFQLKKTVFALPKINRRKIKMFFQKLKTVFLKRSFRKDRIQGLTLKAGTSIGLKFLEAKLPKRAFRGMKGNIFKRVYLKKAFALITIFAVIVTAYWQNNQTAPLET